LLLFGGKKSEFEGFDFSIENSLIPKVIFLFYVYTLVAPNCLGLVNGVDVKN
jgi:hypothetical protein